MNTHTKLETAKYQVKMNTCFQGEKKNSINLSSAESSQRVAKVKRKPHWEMCRLYHMHLAKTQISLCSCSVWSDFTVQVKKPLSPWLYAEHLEKTLIRISRCADWSEKVLDISFHIASQFLMILKNGSFPSKEHIMVMIIWGSCKKFCHWVRITSVLRFLEHIFITNLQSIPPLLKHIFVTFLPSRKNQINSLLLVSVGDTDK